MTCQCIIAVDDITEVSSHDRKNPKCPFYGLYFFIRCISCHSLWRDYELAIPERCLPLDHVCEWKEFEGFSVCKGCFNMRSKQ